MDERRSEVEFWKNALRTTKYVPLIPLRLPTVVVDLYRYVRGRHYNNLSHTDWGYAAGILGALAVNTVISMGYSYLSNDSVLGNETTNAIGQGVSLGSNAISLVYEIVKAKKRSDLHSGLERIIEPSEPISTH